LVVLVPFEDLGSVLQTNLSPADMADDAFAQGQVELISGAARELLDLAGLMLFIDELAGGEATLGSVRLRDVADALAAMEQSGNGAPLRVELLLTYAGG